MSAPLATGRIQNVRVSNSEKIRLSLLQSVPAIGQTRLAKMPYEAKISANHSQVGRIAADNVIGATVPERFEAFDWLGPPWQFRPVAESGSATGWRFLGRNLRP
jgi:hypothetical protein